MLATSTIAEEILDLKQERRAILLAHHYQESEIQELADVVGDSLELARKARDFEGDVIAFCGVWFMAETAKVLNPDRIVVVPDREAGCSLVESCPVEPVRAYQAAASRSRDRQLHQYFDRGEGGERHPLHVAQCREDREFDSRGKPVLFLPDVNLGNYVQAADRPREHEDLAGRLHRARHLPGAACWPRRSAEHPRRQGGGASRVPAESVLAMADFIGSTSAIIEWCVAATPTSSSS